MGISSTHVMHIMFVAVTARTRSAVPVDTVWLLREMNPLRTEAKRKKKSIEGAVPQFSLCGDFNEGVVHEPVIC